jgi:hypothetical protein
MTTTISGTTGIDKVQETAPGVIPIGGGLDHYGATAPVNYLALPLVATNISRTTYAKLFAAIGTTWGVGDGSTTFGMPYCPANYTSVQANGNVGTTTVGEVIAHTHPINYVANLTGAGSNQGSGAVNNATLGSATGSTGGSANLPAGIRVLKCVRYQ